ncbi:hypothetical protein [Hymenobacter bucti]|uniref:Glycosyltransferase RgtA/B/C/D-like domain-containing protein n=1 Tax=Hymenobacter bucti TaxID=1844114 RepID=A0ABW4QUI3_9BACT
MKLAVALLLNLGLLVTLGWWLRREYRRAGPVLRRWLLPALVLRVVAGTFQHSSDAYFLHAWGQGFTAQFWMRPAAGGLALWQGHQVWYGPHTWSVYRWSNALFVSKILALLNFVTLGSFWLAGVYLSLGCYVACWGLVRTLRQLWPAAPVGAGVLAFLLWPSVVWWSAGITKETLVLGSGAALVAMLLNSLYYRLPAAGWQQLGWWGLLLGLGWLQVRLRYFFALPLLGSLLALVGVVRAERRGWLPAGWRAQGLGLLAGVALAGPLVVAAGGEPVSKAFVTSQLWGNYLHGVATSAGRPHLEYPGLQPTLGSMASHFPVAAAQTLVRPWLGESAGLRYVGVGLENLLLLGLLVLATTAVVRGRPGRLPAALVLTLLLYCVVLAGLIGLSTPNLGTLLRYRTVLLPWLLWLLLQNDYARRLLRRLGLGD